MLILDTKAHSFESVHDHVQYCEGLFGRESFSFPELRSFIVSAALSKRLAALGTKMVKNVAVVFAVDKWVCSFRRIQKRIFDPRLARFRGRKVGFCTLC